MFDKSISHCAKTVLFHSEPTTETTTMPATITALTTSSDKCISLQANLPSNRTALTVRIKMITPKINNEHITDFLKFSGLCKFTFYCTYLLTRIIKL